MGPQNVITGDEFAADIPQTEMPEENLSEERKAAKFSRTAEFARLKKHLEDRRAFYQSYLPSGQPIAAADAVPLQQRGEHWSVANAIIAEINSIIGFYEQANEAVKSVK